MVKVSIFVIFMIYFILNASNKCDFDNIEILLHFEWFIINWYILVILINDADAYWDAGVSWGPGIA